MKEIKAPNSYTKEKRPFIFLSGSIEMGLATNWQERVVKELAHKKGTILNPRRSAWDKSWIQSINNPQFKQQVDWELSGLGNADCILMYFDPQTSSPISLLELGLFHNKKIIVCCPDGYWRKGNVEIVCNMYNIPLVSTLEELIEQGEKFDR